MRLHSFFIIFAVLFPVSLLSQTDNWIKVSGSWETPENYATHEFSEFKDYLYASFAKVSGNLGSAEIWRSQSGSSNTWEKVIFDADVKTIKSIPSMNTTTLGDGYMWIACSDQAGGGCVIYRSSDGTNWVKINNNGFGDTNSFSPSPNMVLYQGQGDAVPYLYAGSGSHSTSNNGPSAEIWRIPYTDTNPSKWEKVLDFKDIDPSVTQITYFYIWNNKIYFGVNAGARLFESSNGKTFSENLYLSNAIKGKKNGVIACIIDFDNKLYISTNNTITGGQLYSSVDGISWMSVTENAFGKGNAVIELHNLDTTFGYLWVTGYTDIAKLQGCPIWKSNDGKNFNQSNTDGFGDKNNNGENPVTIGFENHQYFGCPNYANGAQIWRSNMNPLAVSINTKNTSCYAKNDGQLEAIVSGGNSPYSYQWSTGQTTSAISNIPAGYYSVTIADANGDTITQSTTLSSPKEIIITAAVTDASCYGLADGKIDLSLSGAIEPITVNWSNGEKTEDLVSVAAGSYSVVITDANHCETTNTLTVSEPTILATSFSVNHVECYGYNTGSIEISVNGGTSPYAYMWSNGSTNSWQTNLYAGVYDFTVYDNNGCSGSFGNLEITQPEQLLLNATIADENCATSIKGSIDISVSGGTMPYSFLWSNGNTDEDITTAVAGNYNITVTDFNNCQQSSSYTISSIAPFTLKANISNPTCSSCNNGKISLSIVGGQTPFTYLWNNGSTKKNQTNLSAGTYSVTVTGNKGCSAYQSYTLIDVSLKMDTLAILNASKTIMVYPNPANSYLIVDIINFESEVAEIKIMNANGTIVFQNYTILDAPFQTETINIELLPAGTYYLQFTAHSDSFNHILIKY